MFGNVDVTKKVKALVRKQKLDALFKALINNSKALINNSLLEIEAVMGLVRNGVDLNTENDEGDSLLHILAKTNGQYDKEIEELVNIHKANINIRNDKGYTPLQCLINLDFFKTSAAMKLVSLGADPDSKNYKGNSLLHILSTAANYSIGGNDKAIEQLVNIYNANIDIKNAQRFSPLQCLISNSPLKIFAAMKLVHLGADPDCKSHFVDYKGDSLSVILSKNNANGKYDETIEELERLSIRHHKKKHHPARNNFLNLLIILTNDVNNQHSNSYFKNLPKEIISFIVSFLNCREMGITQQECFDLAFEILSQPKKIKNMMSNPGGVNVFQHKTGTPKFTFFKSVQIFCLDYEELKSKLETNQIHKNPTFDEITGKKFTNSSINILNKFTNDYALIFWNEHSSLYNKQANKQKLFTSIKDADPYKNPGVQSEIIQNYKMKL